MRQEAQDEQVQALLTELPALQDDLVDLERKLIPLLNRVRALLGKPGIRYEDRVRHDPTKEE